MNAIGVIATSVRRPEACFDASRTRSIRASVRTRVDATPGSAGPSTNSRATLTRQQLRSQSGISLPRARTAGHLRRRLTDGARCDAKRVAASATAPSPSSNLAIYAEAFEIGPRSMMEVTLTEDEVILSTDLPGSLILHWGVEQAGKTGWNFPPTADWPEKTIQYKDRALQSPFMQADGYSWLRIPRPQLLGATYFNFVVKDAASNKWYNPTASNWSLR
eukprot:CAMPEP_0118941326 /NCGR_PEP_ID=MMETSP1169-20130426/33602_1 /TAXON_ID=36882 /ORGANISM="Pyramimonas obovata, Strain CCMP722" /LENGTH=218 /DNA_ID=CAMNT_0006886045 /DNA_START=131 /DNA_END=783 /DNA_ORIENTATION=-